MAASGLAQSISSYAHIFSLDLANGPFVSTTLPLRTRTVVASPGDRSGFPYTRIPRPFIFLIQAMISFTKVSVGVKEASWQMISRYCM